MSHLRLACIALGLCLPLAALYVEGARGYDHPLAFENVMPTTLGEWTSLQDETLSGEVAFILAPETYTLRIYRAAKQPQIVIYAALYRGVGPTGAHDPLICYPAQGWTITERREIEIALAEGGAFPAWYLHTELAGAEELVVYWLQPRDRWPARSLRENSLRVLDRLRGHPEYTFIRLSLRRPPVHRQASSSDLEALLTLAREVAPWARAALAPLPARGALQALPHPSSAPRISGTSSTRPLKAEPL